MLQIINNDFFILTNKHLASVKSNFFGYIYDRTYLNLRIRPSDPISPLAGGTFVDISVTQNKITICQDYHCSFGLFVFTHKKFFAVSNSFFYLFSYLTAYYELSINHDYTSLYLCDMVPYSLTETPINEITEIAQGEYLLIDISSSSLNIEKSNYSKSTINPCSQTGIEKLDKWHLKFSNIISSLADCGYLIKADLSGGFDSRAACSTLFKPDIFEKIDFFLSMMRRIPISKTFKLQLQFLIHTILRQANAPNLNQSPTAFPRMKLY